MVQIFTAFLLVSVIGTALALMLTLLRPLTRKVFSSGWHYYMWLVVLLIMVLPVRIPLPEASVNTLPVAESTIILDNEADYAEMPMDIETPSEQIIQEQPTLPKKISMLLAVKGFLNNNAFRISLIWIFGIVLLFLKKIISYLIILIKIHKRSEKISCPEIKAYTNRNIKTRVSDTICSPFLVGIIRPTLMLPKIDLTSEQLHNVLAHEMTHLNRNDILYKWFVSIVKCIHWFNPVIYIIGRQIGVDCEISCDSAVIKGMDEQQKKGYAETILTLLTQRNLKNIPLTTGMTGDKNTLKRRFEMIKSKIRISRKVTVISGIIAVLILTTVVYTSGILNGIFFNIYNHSIMEVNTDKATGDNFNLLFVGRDNNSRADAIMLLIVKEDGIKGLSIPRNTIFDGKKISDILATKNGNQTAIDTIKNKFSVPIHYYAEMNLSAVKEIVDGVGGIEFEVPMDMVYVDPYQHPHITSQKGVRVWSGEEVCQLLQYRRGYPEGDLSRMELHQKFVKEFIRQKIKKENIGKARKIFNIISDNIKTNYPVGNLKKDFKTINAISQENIILETISGRTTLYNQMNVYELGE